MAQTNSAEESAVKCSVLYNAIGISRVVHNGYSVWYGITNWYCYVSNCLLFSEFKRLIAWATPRISQWVFCLVWHYKLVLLCIELLIILRIQKVNRVGSYWLKVSYKAKKRLRSVENIKWCLCSGVAKGLSQGGSI